MQLYLLLFACFLQLNGSQTVNDDRLVAYIDGRFVIGVLLPIHYQPDATQKRIIQGGIQCGRIREDYGVQRVEVVLYTIDNINKDLNLLPNLTLGVEIRDECWYAPIALQQSIEFVRDYLGPKSCANTSFPDHSSPLIGVIGPGASSIALQVQNLLQLFHLPQIGYSTTSKDLSDKSRFNYFMRVVPSDYYQAQVILDILQYQNWSYVSAVYTDENYGQAGIQAFRELLADVEVCIAKEDSILSNAGNSAFDKVIRNLHQESRAVVVVCFCEGLTVRGLLQAAKRLNMTDRFLFIGSDGWGDRSDVVESLQSEAWGSLSIRINSPYIGEFTNYYLGLKPQNNARNPWFREFWEAKFNCTFGTRDAGWRNACTGEELLLDGYRQDSKLSFVIKAIYSFAYGLHNMQQSLCGTNYAGVCDEMLPFNGSLFKQFLMNVSFTYHGELIEFDENGDPPGKYVILNYQRLENGSFNYVTVGNWHNGSLEMDELQLGRRSTIKSRCTDPCGIGQYAKSANNGEDKKKCCWICMNCSANEIYNNSKECVECAKGSFPNATQTGCIELPVIHTEWYDPEAIVITVSSATGFFAAAYSLVLFIKYNNTPVVKSSTRELSYIILIGMMLAYASVFSVLATPSTVHCALVRFFPNLAFAMVYGALLTKTNRIARILAGSKKRFPTKKRLFMSTTSQLCITVFLIAVQVFVSLWMLYEEPPDYEFRYEKSRTIMECNTTPEGIVIPLTFNFFLILLCTLYALKTRNVPENFNEAKFIGFAMYTTCVIWIAFISIYFGSDAKVVTLCMCIILSAIVAWVFLFVPKLYIILLKPERNNRSFFTTTDKTIRCHIGSKVSSALADKSPPLTDRSLANNNFNGNASYKDVGKQHGVPEKRTLSCQTGVELLSVLLNPKSLMELHGESKTYVPRITEQNCCQGNECELKNITIRLPDVRY